MPLNFTPSYYPQKKWVPIFLLMGTIFFGNGYPFWGKNSTHFLKM